MSEPNAAHLENGYTRIANKLLEAILAARFSAAEAKILLALVRMTYGWQRKNVRIGRREWARRSGLEYTGGWCKALRGLIGAGVIRHTSHGSGVLGEYAVNKSFGAWGKYASDERSLQSLWSADFDGYARESAPNLGPTKPRPHEAQASPSPLSRPHEAQGTQPKVSNDNELRAPKERKKPLRGGSDRKERETRPNWTTDFGNDWSAIKKGVAPFAKIGAQLKPLFEPPLNLTPEEVRPRWQAFLRSEKSKYGPAHFAENYGDYSGAKSPNANEQLRKRGITLDG